LVDLNSGNAQHGICTLPYIRFSYEKPIWFHVNIMGNFYVSHGMAADNTPDKLFATANPSFTNEISE